MNSENKKKKNVGLLVGCILLLIVIIVIICFIFLKTRSYAISFDTDGGTVIESIKVKNNEIVKLPDEPTKDDYVFAGWADKDDNYVLSGTKITGNMTLKAIWIKKDKKMFTITFNSEDEETIGKIVIEDNYITKLPKTPKKEGYVFVGWVNENNEIIQIGSYIKENITVKELWREKNKTTNKITFNTDGGNNIEELLVESNKNITLPIEPVKDGYIFKGWQDQFGNIIDKDTIITKDLVLIAIWKKPYVCPKDCTPIGDGSTCKREKTTNLVTTYSCPSGYTLFNGKCLNFNNKYFSENQSSDKSWTGCKGNDYRYDEIIGGGVIAYCLKQTDKIASKNCPSGYTKDGTNCKKTEIVNCPIETD